jgi:hypothetical protein
MSRNVKLCVPVGQAGQSLLRPKFAQPSRAPVERYRSGKTQTVWRTRCDDCSAKSRRPCHFGPNPKGRTGDLLDQSAVGNVRSSSSMILPRTSPASIRPPMFTTTSAAQYGRLRAPAAKGHSEDRSHAAKESAMEAEEEREQEFNEAFSRRAFHEKRHLRCGAMGWR